MVDAATVVERLEAWWVELFGVLVASVGGAIAYLDGDYVTLVVALALAVYAVDRTRIRLDNRSMARVLRDRRDKETD